MSKLLKEVAKKVNKFWFHKESTLTLGTFRVIFGLFILSILLLSYFNWDSYYGIHGIIPLDEFIESRGGWFRAGLKSVFAWSDSEYFVWIIYGFSLLISLTFTLGIGTKLSTLLLYILWFSMCNRNVVIIDGKDAVIRMLLFYSCFAPLGNSLSVDNYLRKRLAQRFSTLKQYQPGRKSVWSWRLMQVSITLIYPFSALDKLRSDTAWIDGTMMYYTSLYDGWFRFTHVDFFHNLTLSMLVTYGTLIIEFIFPILVWFKPTKVIALVLVSSLHISIGIIMNQYILQFSMVMLISFILFIEPETIRKIMRYFVLWYRKLHRVKLAQNYTVD